MKKDVPPNLPTLKGGEEVRFETVKDFRLGSRGRDADDKRMCVRPFSVHLVNVVVGAVTAFR